MTIVQEAQQFLNEEIAEEMDSFIAHDFFIGRNDKAEKIIRGLITEIKCLKVQVCDRGNSYQKADEERKRLRAVMEDCVAGHDDCCNYVCNKIKEALSE